METMRTWPEEVFEMPHNTPLHTYLTLDNLSHSSSPQELLKLAEAMRRSPEAEHPITQYALGHAAAEAAVFRYPARNKTRSFSLDKREEALDIAEDAWHIAAKGFLTLAKATRNTDQKALVIDMALRARIDIAYLHTSELIAAWMNGETTNPIDDMKSVDDTREGLLTLSTSLLESKALQKEFFKKRRVGLANKLVTGLLAQGAITDHALITASLRQHHFPKRSHRIDFVSASATPMHRRVTIKTSTDPRFHEVQGDARSNMIKVDPENDLSLPHSTYSIHTLSAIIRGTYPEEISALSHNLSQRVIDLHYAIDNKHNR